MQKRFRVISLLATFVVPSLALAQGPQLLGVGAYTCASFKRKVVEIKAVRAQMVADRLALPPELDKTQAQLLGIQDAIDSWFEGSFNEYAFGVVQKETLSYVDRVHYTELMGRMVGYRFALEFSDFCENPEAVDETFYRFVNELQKTLIKILSESPKLQR